MVTFLHLTILEKRVFSSLFNLGNTVKIECG